jgi:hypothetical protein
LSAADWTTFNNKQPAGTYVTNLTGPITSVGNATSIASQTGTGTKFVVDNTPTLITPVLGVATATSINKMAITAPATSSTLAVADGKTLTANKTLTLDGTDSTTMTFPATSATIARTDAAQTFTGAQTFSTAIAVGSGGTGLSTLTSGYIPYGNGTSAYSSSDTFVFNGTTLRIGTATAPEQTTAGSITFGPRGLEANVTSTIAASGTVDLTLVTGTYFSAPNGFAGILVVTSCSTDYTPQSRRQVLSVAGRGTTLATNILTTQDGSAGGMTFTLTMPSNGVIRFTETSGAPSEVTMVFIGCKTLT